MSWTDGLQNNIWIMKTKLNKLTQLLTIPCLLHTYQIDENSILCTFYNRKTLNTEQTINYDTYIISQYLVFLLIQSLHSLLLLLHYILS